MRGSVVVGALAAAMSLVALAAPVLAHGEGDARALARDVSAGPYRVSLWQVDGNSATGMNPHVIVMFDGAMPSAGVVVAVNAAPVEARPSVTTTNGWETTQGVADGDQLSVTIAEGGQAWHVGPVVVTPVQPPIPFLKEVILASVLVTARVLWWGARRTLKTWRAPVHGQTQPVPTPFSEGVLQG